MKNRQSMILYALEAVARPGCRETRVRRPPENEKIRNERGALHV